MLTSSSDVKDVKQHPGCVRRTGSNTLQIQQEYQKTTTLCLNTPFCTHTYVNPPCLRGPHRAREGSVMIDSWLGSGGAAAVEGF